MRTPPQHEQHAARGAPRCHRETPALAARIFFQSGNDTFSRVEDLSLWDAGNLFIKAARNILQNGNALYGLATNSSLAFQNDTDVLYIVRGLQAIRSAAAPCLRVRCCTPTRNHVHLYVRARVPSRSFTTAHAPSWRRIRCACEGSNRGQVPLMWARAQCHLSFRPRAPKAPPAAREVRGMRWCLTEMQRTLDGLMQQAIQDSNQVNNIQLIILAVEGACVGLASVVVVWIVSSKLLARRVAVYSVFMLIPSGVIKAQASRPVNLEEGGEDEDDAGQAEVSMGGRPALSVR